LMEYKKLIKQYGSPLYVYDLKVVREAFSALRDSLPESAMILYSFKANPHPTLAKQLLTLGCYAEVSSPQELDTAIQIKGNADNCYYTGPGKSTTEISYAITKGVKNFS